ncbi:MAG: double zinc ribbon domain-containing protein [Oscillospiraceae bacterium]|nr:double zinc ribbon domain-containing protein [Oscillospiraceae bacterium]
MNKPASRLLSVVYPNRCGFCGAVIEHDKLVCARCAGRVEREIERSKTQFPLYLSVGEVVFSGCSAAGSYDGTIRDGVLRLKYHYGENAAKYLVPELRDNLYRAGVVSQCDMITYVPMSRIRKNKYGYNQAEIIARLLSKELGIPVVKNLIRKKHTRKAQHEQSLEQRQILASKVYKPGINKTDITGKTVLLCDDIITSGSTLNECAKVLKSRGAEKVYCAVLAQLAD